MSKARAISLKYSYYLQQKAVSYFNEVIDVLYGDESKTRRTLGLCMLAMAFGFLLANQAPLACGM